MTKLDRTALAAYCQAYSRWVGAEEKIAAFGMVIKTPSGYPVQSPYVSISRQATKQMREFLVEFGMTPSSRSRIEVALPKAADPLEEIRRKRDEARRKRV